MLCDYAIKKASFTLLFVSDAENPFLSKFVLKFWTEHA